MTLLTKRLKRAFGMLLGGRLLFVGRFGKSEPKAMQVEGRWNVQARDRKKPR